MSEDCLTFFVWVGKTNWASIVAAARLAQLEERRSVEREVVKLAVLAVNSLSQFR